MPTMIIKSDENIPTSDEFLKDMQTVASSNDPECSHVYMDDMMCDLLKQLGYGEAIEVFRHTEKWYA